MDPRAGTAGSMERGSAHPRVICRGCSLLLPLDSGEPEATARQWIPNLIRAFPVAWIRAIAHSSHQIIVFGYRFPSSFPACGPRSETWPKRICCSSTSTILNQFNSNVVSTAYINSLLLNGVSIWNQIGVPSNSFDGTDVLPARLAYSPSNRC